MTPFQEPAKYLPSRLGPTRVATFNSTEEACHLLLKPSRLFIESLCWTMGHRSLLLNLDHTFGAAGFDFFHAGYDFLREFEERLGVG